MFYGFVITEGGNRLLAKMVAGQTLELSRVVMDKGTAESAEAARKLTAPIDPGPEGTSTAPTVDANTVHTVVEYRSDLNGGLAAGFWIGGFSVYAVDPDSGADVMIYYGSLGDAKQYVSAYAPGTAPDVRRYPVSITVTAGVEVTVSYPAEAWMTAQDVADYFNGTLRPELEASLTLLIGAHDTDPDAHGGLRAMIQDNTDAVALADAAAAKAQKAADAAGNAGKAAQETADDALTAAGAAQETADNALQLATDAGAEAVVAKRDAATAMTAANEAKRDAANAATDAEKAQAAADAAMEAVTKLAHTIDDVPSQNGTLTFTGGAQSPGWNSYNPKTMTMGGVTTGTNAGTYTATFTPKEGYTWGDGTSTAKSADWSIGRATISTVPSQSDGLAYTGNAQTPAWSNYNSAQLTIGGNSGTNAGTYAATFTPTANYQWSDGATAAKSVNWTIAKAAGTLTLNKSTVELTNGALTGAITVTRTGDGAISATSSDTGVATVSVSGTTVTVTGKAYGTATITVSVAAGTNHNAPANKTCSTTVKFYNTTLNSNTWARIKEASDAGMAASIWNVGDTKNIKINGKVGNTTFYNLSIDAFVIGFNHNSSREGSNRIHFQIGKIGGKLVGLVGNNYSYEGYFAMNASETNRGGWKSSEMRITVLGSNGIPESPTDNTMLSALPSDLREVMKSCTKYSDNTGGGSDTAGYVTSTTDYLFLLAEWEYHGARTSANSAEKNFQAQYDYYKAGNSKAHYKHNETGTAASAWCRSVSPGNESSFCLVRTDGGAFGSTSANYSWAMAPGFCV